MRVHGRSIDLERAAEQCTSAIYASNTTNPPPMRLTSPTLCDPDVRQQSGYVDMEDKHIFFWYFGSRTRLAKGFNASADTVPLVFWFSGGPGCSSQIANWQENGPCQYKPSVPYDASMPDDARKRLPHSVQRNPYAWNAVADVVFIDQPVGTGFSYGAMPSSTEAAADPAWRTMQAIYAQLSATAAAAGEAAIADVYLFGESYAGRYIPVFAEYAMHMNDQIDRSEALRARGYRHLPLRGVGIGNGLVDFPLQRNSAYKMGCDSTYPALFTSQQCKYLRSTILPRCTKLVESCYVGPGMNSTSADGMRTGGCSHLAPEPWRASAQCAEADSYCNSPLEWTTAVSTYDVRPNARMVPDDYIEYLRTPEFKRAVGASGTIDYVECSDPVFNSFTASVDEVSRSAKSSLSNILDRNLPVLLYSGDADFICNWYGTVSVIRALDWHGKAAMAAARSRPWSWPAQSGARIAAGRYVAADNLTFLRVFEAGHEVPYYQPEAALYMLAQFLAKKTLS
ncbi:hypothetical protein IWQ56_002241 [Coemansia nantahalensis]|uniref:Uncharacterized protein n=1 Tax=Coemansia nantahalensis TaxID=2789366 RepID=A0ACC1K0W9_9FUNG|nr:hypothetical protein IWQ56_002241 [Coemansia nantahalensis]KAJ2771140.1 hypothetical protein IWQ57_002344 [Coemansia nantahalensis]